MTGKSETEEGKKTHKRYINECVTGDLSVQGPQKKLYGIHLELSTRRLGNWGIYLLPSLFIEDYPLCSATYSSSLHSHLVELALGLLEKALGQRRGTNVWGRRLSLFWSHLSQLQVTSNELRELKPSTVSTISTYIWNSKITYVNFHKPALDSGMDNSDWRKDVTSQKYMGTWAVSPVKYFFLPSLVRYQPVTSKTQGPSLVLGLLLLSLVQKHVQHHVFNTYWSRLFERLPFNA